VFVEAKKFCGFKEKRQFWQMSSFSEPKALQLLNKKETRTQFMAYNSHNLSRIYPKGSRVDSSNLDPHRMWAGGCQMVALNFQEAGGSMMHNRAKFQQNGGCGYVLKPELLSGHHRPKITKNLC